MVTLFHIVYGYLEIVLHVAGRYDFQEMYVLALLDSRSFFARDWFLVLFLASAVALVVAFLTIVIAGNIRLVTRHALFLAGSSCFYGIHIYSPRVGPIRCAVIRSLLLLVGFGERVRVLGSPILLLPSVNPIVNSDSHSDIFVEGIGSVLLVEFVFDFFLQAIIE